jgi:hypothetical protein
MAMPLPSFTFASLWPWRRATSQRHAATPINDHPDKQAAQFVCSLLQDQDGSLFDVERAVRDFQVRA